MYLFTKHNATVCILLFLYSKMYLICSKSIAPSLVDKHESPDNTDIFKVTKVIIQLLLIQCIHMQIGNMDIYTVKTHTELCMLPIFCMLC